MDKVTKSIFVALSVLIIVAIVATYYRTIVRKDYVIFPDETAAEESVLADESTLIGPPSESDPSFSGEYEDVTP
ncbi:MAG TPA: hypothetical protein VI483_03575 [Candidatus Paceibacterota bacterium]